MRTYRQKRAVEAYRHAAETIGTITEGYSLFGITRGQFSMIDLLLACLDQVGRARVSLWTWCIAEYEVQCFNRLLIDDRISSALLVIDSGARGKNRDLLLDWRAKHGEESIRFVVNHAKLATVETSRFKLLLRGSMNLNYNPRFEQFDLDEGHPGFDLVRGIEEKLPVLRFDCTHNEAWTATGISTAWSDQKLLPFAALKTWVK